MCCWCWCWCWCCAASDRDVPRRSPDQPRHHAAQEPLAAVPVLPLAGPHANLPLPSSLAYCDHPPLLFSLVVAGGHRDVSFVEQQAVPGLQQEPLPEVLPPGPQRVAQHRRPSHAALHQRPPPGRGESPSPTLPWLLDCMYVCMYVCSTLWRRRCGSCRPRTSARSPATACCSLAGRGGSRCTSWARTCATSRRPTCP